MPSQTSTVYLTVQSVLGGTATNLAVDGKPVMLESASGLTSGVIAGTPQPWSVSSAGQQKLTAD